VETGAVKPEDVEIVPGATGAFEIFRDGAPVFSRLASGRFPEDAEVDALVL
jgi:selT/selW/selH-like putative selenoprotein